VGAIRLLEILGVNEGMTFYVKGLKDLQQKTSVNDHPQRHVEESNAQRRGQKGRKRSEKKISKKNRLVGADVNLGDITGLPGLVLGVLLHCCVLVSPTPESSLTKALR